MKAITTAKKIGGSIMVTIPKEIVKEENIQEGELISIEVGKVRKSFFGALKGMAPYKKERFSDFD